MDPADVAARALALDERAEEVVQEAVDVAQEDSSLATAVDHVTNDEAPDLNIHDESDISVDEEGSV